MIIIVVLLVLVCCIGIELRDQHDKVSQFEWLSDTITESFVSIMLIHFFLISPSKISFFIKKGAFQAINLLSDAPNWLL